MLHPPPRHWGTGCLRHLVGAVRSTPRPPDRHMQYTFAVQQPTAAGDVGVVDDAGARSDRRPPIRRRRAAGAGRRPILVRVLNHDQATLPEADELAVGMAGQQQAGQLSEVGHVPDHHHVSGLLGEPTGPRRRIIVGRGTVTSSVSTSTSRPQIPQSGGTASCRNGRLGGPRPNRSTAQCATQATSSAPRSVSGRCGSSSSGLACPCWTRYTITAVTVGAVLTAVRWRVGRTAGWPRVRWNIASSRSTTTSAWLPSNADVRDDVRLRAGRPAPATRDAAASSRRSPATSKPWTTSSAFKQGRCRSSGAFRPHHGDARRPTS